MKKPKISDAMDYIDDDLISGAAEYQPKKAKYHTWTRWAAMAACLCLVIGATILLPHMGNHPSEPQLGSTDDNPTNSQPGNKDNHLPDPQPGSIVLSDKTTAKVSCGYDESDIIMTEEELVYLTEDEMFSQEKMYVFRGKVSGLTNITIDFNGEREVRCVATVVIDRVYRGDISEGEQIRVLLPSPIAENKIGAEDTGIISQLKSGMEGIFMPLVYTEESCLEKNGDVLMYRDIAPCGLRDGMRWAFLDTERGLVFERNAYPGASNAENLDEIEEYVIEKLK